jgi:hypothetical protein
MEPPRQPDVPTITSRSHPTPRPGAACSFSRAAAFGEMVAYLKAHPSVRVMLVEKTDRLYRNLKDWVTVDELDVEMHFPKEGVVLSRESRSSEKFMHGDIERAIRRESRQQLVAFNQRIGLLALRDSAAIP